MLLSFWRSYQLKTVSKCYDWVQSPSVAYFCVLLSFSLCSAGHWSQGLVHAKNSTAAERLSLYLKTVSSAVLKHFCPSSFNPLNCTLLLLFSCLLFFFLWGEALFLRLWSWPQLSWWKSFSVYLPAFGVISPWCFNGYSKPWNSLPINFFEMLQDFPPFLI